MDTRPSTLNVSGGPKSAEIIPTLQHWLMLGALVVCGGSSFAGIRVAVETAPPSVVAAGRLWVATLFLFVYMASTGRTMLPLRKDGGIHGIWLFAAAIGAVGYALPMILFPFAQQTVSSMLAGIYMAFMPIATVFLAAFFADEPLTKRKLTGFAAGTAGVLILVGPAALKNIFSDSVVAQGALVLASTAYAVASVITRRAPAAPARSFAVAFMLCASVISTPGAIISLATNPDISVNSWLAIVYLGIVPTGINAILIVHIIRGAGAGFIAMGNYLTPLVAIVFGMLLFREVLHARYIYGLVAIIIGLTIAQPGPLRAAQEWINRWRRADQSDRAGK